MIIIDCKNLYLKSMEGENFEELEFLPFINNIVKIEGVLTYRKLRNIISKYPLLKYIYSDFNDMLSQYNYDSALGIKSTREDLLNILIKNDFQILSKNFIENQQKITTMFGDFIVTDYKESPSMEFNIITDFVLEDKNNQEIILGLTDLKDIIDLPIKIVDGKLSMVTKEGKFTDGKLLNIQNDSRKCEIDTVITFNELMLVLSEVPSFNSSRNKKMRKELNNNYLIKTKKD